MTYEKQANRIKALEKENQALREKIAELERRLGLNSQNSSKPLHKTERYGMVNVIIGCNNLNGEFWAIVSDEKTSLQTFQEYGARFDIEENFLDDQ